MLASLGNKVHLSFDSGESSPSPEQPRTGWDVRFPLRKKTDLHNEAIFFFHLCVLAWTAVTQGIRREKLFLIPGVLRSPWRTLLQWVWLNAVMLHCCYGLVRMLQHLLRILFSQVPPQFSEICTGFQVNRMWHQMCCNSSMKMSVTNGARKTGGFKKEARMKEKRRTIHKARH